LVVFLSYAEWFVGVVGSFPFLSQKRTI